MDKNEIADIKHKKNRDTFVLRTSFFNEEQKSSFRILKASSRDADTVTSVIREAFEVWTKLGVILSPAKQSKDLTNSYINDFGYIIVDSSERTIGTLKLTFNSYFSSSDNNKMSFTCSDSQISYSRIDSFNYNSSNNFLVLSKLAIISSFSRYGIGQNILDELKLFAVRECFDGIVIETVKKADWLYTWYLNNGFIEFGEKLYLGSEYPTILMILKIQKVA